MTGNTVFPFDPDMKRMASLALTGEKLMFPRQQTGVHQSLPARDRPASGTVGHEWDRDAGSQGYKAHGCVQERGAAHCSHRRP